MNAVITTHAESSAVAIASGSAVNNLDLANFTTDFGLKKRLDDPTWEKVTPRVYQATKYIPREKKKKPKKKKEVKPFCSYKADSYNAKASIGKAKE